MFKRIILIIFCIFVVNIASLNGLGEDKDSFFESCYEQEAKVEKAKNKSTELMRIFIQKMFADENVKIRKKEFINFIENQYKNVIFGFFGYESNLNFPLINLDVSKFNYFSKKKSILILGDWSDSFLLEMDFKFKNNQRFGVLRFDYKDSMEVKVIDNLLSVNFGQIRDAEILLLHVILSYLAGYDSIAGLACCRRGSAWIRVIDMLTNPYDYLDTWKKFGFEGTEANTLDTNKINKIKSAVQNGVCFLCRPITDMHEVFCHRYGAFFEIFVEGYLNSFGQYSIFIVQPIKILENLKKQKELNKFNFQLSLCRWDREIGNSLDDRLIELLGSSIKKLDYDDLGHEDPSVSFENMKKYFNI
ncbi:TPA: hypothetical protein DEO28_00440 [Candidatus Dependentiae bacterium]|nr:MAG: hypothetical protein UR14_C0001G0061 [candidate division TM6 bacterium GW2011_GWE2_31_21]KKP54059.1 MAG: hypothetical protein UR43_C0001G0077 [candidate division TM6 bacterium GW2011_GWF2_33_332]HBS48359.1 hypothetical protein [Candidatus Dependentiae bacterium]HBZ72967.1 hypothetical protein [Candidatus Dependentiae bacterium]